jgi:acetyl esterase/lipase
VRGYPAQKEAAIACYHYVVETLRISPDKIIIAGDSAGGMSLLFELTIFNLMTIGNLAAALSLHIRDNPEITAPAAAILISPWIDLSFSKSRKSPLIGVDFVDPQLGALSVSVFIRDGYKAEDPQISPALSTNLKGLVANLVIYGEAEVFQDDIKLWIEQCKKDDVEVSVFVGQGGLHTFPLGGMVADRKLTRQSDEIILGYIQSRVQRQS